MTQPGFPIALAYVLCSILLQEATCLGKSIMQSSLLLYTSLQISNIPPSTEQIAPADVLLPSQNACLITKCSIIYSNSQQLSKLSVNYLTGKAEVELGTHKPLQVHISISVSHIHAELYRGFSTRQLHIEVNTHPTMFFPSSKHFRNKLHLAESSGALAKLHHYK